MLGVTVVDGGSSDRTVSVAKSLGAECLHTEPGRGRQLNAGWRSSKEELMLFLHADSRLPEEYLVANAAQALSTHDLARTAGHFKLEFLDYNPQRKRFYRHLENKSALNKAQTFNGDQGLLISRDFLRRLGGFDESLPFLEDQTIGAAIHQCGQFLTLPGRLQTSARRFESEGTAARYIAMLLIMCARESGCKQFLSNAPALYREQTEVDGRLRLGPLVDALTTEVDQHPAFWMSMAQYARSNAWQLAHALDTLSRGQSQFLNTFDQLIEPRLPKGPVALQVLATVMRASLRPLFPVLAKLMDSTDYSSSASGRTSS